MFAINTHINIGAALSTTLISIAFFNTFDRAPPAKSGSNLNVPQKEQPLPSRANDRTAVKRTHVDLHALEKHAGDLSIDCDHIRVLYAYGAQPAVIFVGSIETSYEVIYISSKCDSLQTFTCSPLANSATFCGFCITIIPGSN